MQVHLDTDTHGDDTTWLALAQKARCDGRAHSRANESAILQVLPGGHLMTDEELTAYEAVPEEDDSEGEQASPAAAHKNGTKRKCKITPPPPAKPAKAGAAPRTAVRKERQHARHEEEEDAFQQSCANEDDRFRIAATQR